jgi:hypothetical protein
MIIVRLLSTRAFLVGVWEPALLWNQYHLRFLSRIACLRTEIHQGNLLAGMLTVLN